MLQRCFEKERRRMRHLDPNYELENPPSLTVWGHLLDTFETLGGWKGLLVIALAIGVFHGIVEYVIARGRKKRQEERRKKQR